MSVISVWITQPKNSDCEFVPQSSSCWRLNLRQEVSVHACRSSGTHNNKSIYGEWTQGYLSVAVRPDRRDETAIPLDAFHQPMMPCGAVGFQSGREGALGDKYKHNKCRFNMFAIQLLGDQTHIHEEIVPTVTWGCCWPQICRIKLLLYLWCEHSATCKIQFTTVWGHKEEHEEDTHMKIFLCGQLTGNTDESEVTSYRPEWHTKVNGSAPLIQGQPATSCCSL